MSPMATKTELDLSIDLSELAPDLQIPACVLEVAYCAVNQVLKNFTLLVSTVWKSISALKPFIWLKIMRFVF